MHGSDYLFGLPGKSDTVNACHEHTQQHADPKIWQEEFDTYQSLVEKALTYRAETIKFHENIRKKLSSDQPLSGAELDYINQGMSAHLDLRETLLSLAHRHECWLYTDKAAMTHAGIDEREHFEGVLLSLSAALLLYDNYLLSISTYADNAKLRRILNQSDRGYGLEQGQLTHVTLSYTSIFNRSRVRRGIKYYEQSIARYNMAEEQDSALGYLSLLISQSPSYNMTKKWSPLLVIGNGIDLFGDISTDAIESFERDGLDIFSMAFGNTVGVVETRKGKLYGRDDVARHLKRALQAGDILLEKTPFRLTDKFIPGHWGHAAIWLGTESELRKLGIWDHPLVTPHHEQVRAGNGVIEALRAGVTLNTLEHFLNVDDVAVLRHRAFDPDEARNILILALRQIGKAYDFNFDIETTDRIVCSELIYHAYTDIQWPTEKTLGRATISPDNIASKALRDGPLKLVLFYQDGQQVKTQQLRQLAKLMGM